MRNIPELSEDYVKDASEVTVTAGSHKCRRYLDLLVNAF
jgi:hypothetical protein